MLTYYRGTQINRFLAVVCVPFLFKLVSLWRTKMKEIDVIMQALNNEAGQVVAINREYQTAFAQVQNLPYQEQRTGELQKVTALRDDKLFKLKTDFINSVDVMANALENLVKTEMIQPIATDDVNTLNLWLSADKVSKSEVENLLLKYQGQGLALRIINQIAVKNDISIDYQSNKSLDDYLNEIEDFENYCKNTVNWLAKVFNMSEDLEIQMNNAYIESAQNQANSLAQSLSQVVKTSKNDNGQGGNNVYR